MRKGLTIVLSLLLLGIIVIVVILLRTNPFLPGSQHQSPVSVVKQNPQFSLGDKKFADGEIYLSNPDANPPTSFEVIGKLLDVSTEGDNLFALVHFTKPRKDVKFLIWYPKGIFVLQKQNVPDLIPLFANIKSKIYRDTSFLKDLKKQINQDVIILISLQTPKSLTKNLSTPTTSMTFQTIIDTYIPCNFKLLAYLNNDISDFTCTPYSYQFHVYDKNL